MLRNVIISCLILTNHLVSAKNDMEKIRNCFQEANSETQLAAILQMEIRNVNDSDLNTLLAYKGVCTSRMAVFQFSPFAKMKYFVEGTEWIEQSIAKDKNVENVYLRLLVQLNVPWFLNYDQDIEEDFNYLMRNLSSSNLPMEYKQKMIASLIKTKNDEVDLGKLNSIYFE